jgi:hypothetical protein
MTGTLKNAQPAGPSARAENRKLAPTLDQVKNRLGGKFKWTAAQNGGFRLLSAIRLYRLRKKPSEGRPEIHPWHEFSRISGGLGPRGVLFLELARCSPFSAAAVTSSYFRIPVTRSVSRIAVFVVQARTTYLELQLCWR